MTAVSPSSTRSWLSAFCFWKMKPRSAAASGWIAERSVWSFIMIWRLLVTCGVTVNRIPVSLNCTLARAAPLAPADEASMTRTGVSSPTRMSASRLSSVVMTGSAWMSASSLRSSAVRNVVSEKPPMLVE